MFLYLIVKLLYHVFFTKTRKPFQFFLKKYASVLLSWNPATKQSDRQQKAQKIPKFEEQLWYFLSS
ncbi:hypothetical protein HMPREF9088_0694 [Enterococcus italicus DSM 15952]|uniref:Uncharacterized protein n=1 Tax=Enterococcus italicus (strain DSM 15952 / CCUG 50447 / LMG 22039 / TP 1.5) TaxID=888064 RepID=E6LEA4_ENTI1|nr:hypothetical protein HMPREF9088_0694 [Enterococcus italicus DSM 15952]HCS29791.1 hypothetical protein [Enterococcus sp.]